MRISTNIIISAISLKKMGKSRQKFFISLTDTNTNTSITQQLQSPIVTYQTVLQLIQSYYPEIDLDSITLYINKSKGWQLFLEDDVENIGEQYYYHQNDGNSITMHMKFHCFYFTENDQKTNVKDNIYGMNQKIIHCHELYKQIKEEYIQDPLDINIFWGNPMWTRDTLKRSHKMPHTFRNTKGEGLQLLNNQLKYMPYINAVTDVLQESDKKVHLYLKPLNQNSFTKKSVFTVTYILAHVEIEEKKGVSVKEGMTNVKLSQQKSHDVGSTEEMANLSELKKKYTEVQKKQGLISAPPNIRNSLPTTTEEKSHLPKVQESQQLQLQSTQSYIQPSSPSKLKVEHTKSSQPHSHEINIEKKFQSQKIVNEQPDEEVLKSFVKKKSEERRTKKMQNKRYMQKKYVYNMWGEGINGQLCKISPEVLEEMLQSSKDMDLLILHTSFPDEHLKVLRKKAKNIILINSNPLYPETSTIFFIKKLFTFLLQNGNGNIQYAYNQALAAAERLKHQFAITDLSPSDREFISYLNDKYVHGGTYACCCYHHHLPSCQLNNNTNASKYAENHYRSHYVVNCQCERSVEYSKSGLMVHYCPEKKKIMQKEYNILSRHFREEEFYFCCCLGYELGYYSQLRNNTTFSNYCLIDENKDPHSMRNKFKYERMPNVENQLEIYDGKLTGDCSKILLEAFKWRGDNSLVGNAVVVANLLEIFTNSETDITICNIYGRKRTGRKTIATHFANLLLIKQLFHRIIRINVTMDTVSEVVKRELDRHKEEGIPFFIFIFSDRNGNEVQLSENGFGLKMGQKINGIVITQNKTRQGSSMNMKVYHLKPEPFNIENCLAYIKMYKHLRREGKKNLQTLFDFVRKNYISDPEALSVYPCELNQFQILNIVNKTTFASYRTFGEALSRIKKSKIQYYLFLMSVIKFTTSGGAVDCEEILEKMEDQVEYLKKKRMLFYKDYRWDENSERKEEKRSSISFEYEKKYEEKQKEEREERVERDEKEEEEQIVQKYVIPEENEEGKEKSEKKQELRKKKNKLKGNYHQRQQSQYDIQTLLDQLANFNHLRQHYYLIYMFQVEQITKKLSSLFKMFINYSTLIPPHRFSHNNPKNQINSLRFKKGHFHEQVYEATTVNPSSYVSKYFTHDIEQILKEFSSDLENKEDQVILQDFLISHAKYLQPKRHNSKKSGLTDSFSKPKMLSRKSSDSHHHHSLSVKDSHSSSFDTEKNIPEETTDIPHIYHIAAVMEAGLQYARTVISTHFIYNRLKEHQKIDLLKYSLILVNNCVIMLKNKVFAKINQPFDIDQDLQIDPTPKKIFQPSHSISIPSSLNQMRSQMEERQAPMGYGRAKSGKDLFNSVRMETTSPNKSNMSERQSGHKPYKRTDELLTNELYRLSTYKGLLYLLSQLERRCDQINNENIIRTKISIQLLGIQVRLEMMQIDTPELKLLSSQKDRHLSRLNQVFNQKNYNIIALKRIIREEVSLNRYSADADQISLIKAHIIVALSLMTSGYGRYKLVRDNFMIQDIERFLNEWNLQLPTQLRRGESNVEVSQSLNEHIIQPSRQNTILDFMRFICQNQSLYLLLLTSFSSETIWRQAAHNPEVEIYQQMLRLFHLFKIRNTNVKSDFYNKLQMIYKKLTLFSKNKNFNSLSTYLHNFLQNFTQQIKSQMHKLEQNLVLTLTAESQIRQNDVKMSIAQKMDSVLERNKHKTELFSIRKKFSYDNLHLLATEHKCNYLCIYASSGKNNQRQICLQTEDGTVTMSQQKIADMLSKMKFKVVFICMPKKKNLAEHLISYNPRKRIIYFDFAFNNFQYLDEKAKGDLLIFQKMMMIKTVSQILQNVIERQSYGSKTALAESFTKVRSNLSFMLTDDKNNVLIRLKNDEFRRCIFMQGIEQNVFEQKGAIKEVKFNHNERIKYVHLNVINKFLSKLHGNQHKDERDKIEIPANRRQFLEVFIYCFKEKYGFSHIFQIDLDTLKGGIRPGKVEEAKGAIIKTFYKKLIDQKIFNYVFSNKKVVLIIETKQEMKKITDAVQKTIDDSTKDYSQEYNHKRHKFHCCDHKNHIQAVIYIFDPEEKVNLTGCHYS